MTYFIGLDVSKQRLDVCTLSEEGAHAFSHFDNNSTGHTALISFLRTKTIALVVLEPTGGYESAVCHALHQESFPIHRVHTIAFHGFARSLGLHKNDKIDAYKLAYYGASMKKASNFFPKDTVLEDLVKRRESLTMQLSNEKKQLKQKQNSCVRESFQEHIRYLERAIQKLNQLVEAHLQGNPQSSEKEALLRSIPGVGKTLAAKLLATMPELGDANYGLNQLAALVGIAPYCRDSGNKQGKRFIRGGRRIPRDALYIAVITGAHKIPLLKSLRERLVQKGKPCKVAIVACMRKLLAIIHALLKRKEKFA